jgi:hypothetical protein
MQLVAHFVILLSLAPLQYVETGNTMNDASTLVGQGQPGGLGLISPS